MRRLALLLRPLLLAGAMAATAALLPLARSHGLPPAEARVADAIWVAAWGCLAWLAVGMALLALSRTPGAVGAVTGRLARRVLPVAARRLVETALGLSLTVGAVAASLPAYADRPQPRPAVTASLDFDRPVAPPASGLDTLGSPGGTAGPAPSPVVAPLPTPTPTGRRTGRAVLDPRLFTGPARRPDDRTVDRTDAADDAVVVRRGDTLWAIAGRHLGRGASDAQIDAEWRRWYAANRAVIGADPDLILPGQRLAAPR